MMDKTCENCGAGFVDRSRAQHGRYCSEKCRARAWREGNPEYQREWCKENPEYHPKYDRAYQEANPEKKAARLRVWSAANPEKMRENKARRRARKKDAYVAPVDRKAIYARDSYTCQLCGKKVDMKKKGPDPMSPSIDHILPLSKGGTHEPRNVQLAHLRCNERKYNCGVDQLRLFGE
jgi:5-methylcytosine-specific restriction endonuclease McrA